MVMSYVDGKEFFAVQDCAAPPAMIMRYQRGSAVLSATTMMCLLNINC